MHYAALKADIKMVEALLEKGKQILLYGFARMYYAALKANVKMVEAILVQGK